MKLDIPGVAVLAREERGAFVDVRFALIDPGAADSLATLLVMLPEAAEVFVPDSWNAECYRDCRKFQGALQIKRSCHGAFGTWRAATTVESVGWLLPGLLLSAANPRREQGVVRVGNT